MARGTGLGMIGVLMAGIAGFVSEGGASSADPELWAAAHHGLAGVAFLFLLAGGVAIGTQPRR